MFFTCPQADQVEATLIGPGYGESCIVHIGNNEWLIVDSCIDKETGEPAALVYLSKIGVSYDKVKWIFVSHWHDDHCAGLAKTFSMCKNAVLCLSTALSRQEFILSVTELESPNDIVMGSGVSELSRVYTEIQQSKRGSCWRSHADRRLLLQSNNPAANGLSTEIWTMSPSDSQFEKSLVEIGGIFADLKGHRRRFPCAKVNDLSVVTYIMVGEIAIILGADLEQTSDNARGWNPIVKSTALPKVPACIFKVPHHGAENGHSNDVWTELLIHKPIAVATPYARGHKPLPTKEDKSRIASLSDRFYLTAGSQLAAISHEDSAVRKTLRELKISVRKAEPEGGIVRIRNEGTQSPLQWNIELFGRAYHCV